MVLLHTFSPSEPFYYFVLTDPSFFTLGEIFLLTGPFSYVKFLDRKPG